MARRSKPASNHAPRASTRQRGRLEGFRSARSQKAGVAQLSQERAGETTLSSPRVVRELLERYGLRPTRSLGQNFLVDGNILRFIVQAGLETDGESDTVPDNVFEIGPGLGVLTRALAEAVTGTGAKLTSVEKDERLRGLLEETLSGLDNVRVVFKDALEFPWQHVPQGSLLVANLPYYISTAILGRLLESGRFRQMTFLVQREVAERLEARPDTEHYGFLSALVALYGQAQKLRDVPRGAFFPPPDVVSSIVRVRVRPGAAPAPGVVRVLEAVLHHRRKTLRNNLLLAGYAPERVSQALERAGLRPEVRGETLPLERIVALAEVLEPVSG